MLENAPCTLLRLSLTALAALFALPAAGTACPYSIRDAGFIVRDPSPYHLYLCVDNEVPGSGQLEERLATSAAELLPDANVKAEIVDLGQHPDHEAAGSLASLDIRKLPAAVLVSPNGDAVPISSAVTRQLTDEDLRAVLTASVSSPKREELKERVVDRWCVLVLAEGTNHTANQRAREAAEAAGKEIVGKSTELEPPIETEPHLLTVMGDDPDEQILLASLQLTDGDPADPRLAVVFGVGRRLGPVLRGAEIGERSVLAYLETLGRNCTCTSDPGELLGPSVPLVWDADTRARVREALGFDPEKPAVRMVLAGVWESLMAADTGSDEPFGYADEYVEFPVETTAQPPTGGATVPEGRTALAARIARTVIILLGAAGVLVAAAGAVVFLRRAKSR